MRCSTKNCKKHPKHPRGEIGHHRGEDVSCFSAGEFESYASYVESGLLPGYAPCVNHEPCTGCPECQPLPEWAKAEKAQETTGE